MRGENVNILELPAVSIHAPAGGATADNSNPSGNEVFQSTRPRGARHFVRGFLYTVCHVSIHAPAGGATFV